MKVKVVKLKTVVLIVLATWSISSFAQTRTIMYVMKNGAVVFQSAVSDIDNATFDKAASGDALILQKNDGSPDDKILLNDIQQLAFSDETLSVETANGSETVALETITKLAFGDAGNTVIINPPAGFDVLVSVTPAGEVTVKSSAAIRSLTVFDITGKMISVEKCNAAAPAVAVETWHAASLQKNAPAGIYLFRVETEQGTVVKKAVKPSNK